MSSGTEGQMCVFNLLGSVLGASGSSSDVRDCAGVWRHALFSKTLDAAQRLAVFSTSHAAFSHVLQSAPHATISMQLYGADDPAATVTELTLAAKALAMRGRLPTKVMLEQADDRHATMDLVHAHLFQPAGAQVSQLSLQLQPHPFKALSDFLTAASIALPNLQQLHLGRLTTPLPPGLFPRLTNLCVHVARMRSGDQQTERAVCSSISPYLPQLTSLRTAGLDISLPHVFTPTSTSHTLRHLHTNSDLDDTLLSLLLQHAPSLQHLSVGRVSIRADHSQAAWGVQQITTTHAETGILHASTLISLPTNHSQQRVVLEDPGSRVIRVLMVLSEQGVPQNILDGLFSRFHITRLCFVLPLFVPASFTVTLHQLASTQQSQQPLAVEVTLNNLQWPELLQAVSATAAALPQLHVTLSFDTLDDALLDALLQHAPDVWGVKAYGLELCDTRHSNTQRPWSSLVIKNIKHVRELACLPIPKAGSRLVAMPANVAMPGRPTDISWAFTQEKVSCGLADAIIARVHCFGLELAPDPVITISNQGLASAAEQPAVLRASLQLLRDTRLANRPGGAASSIRTLYLDGWNLTVAVIAELEGLPQWGGQLLFSDEISWPADAGAEAYQQLGRVVPVTYTSWSVASCMWAVEQLVEVCRGVGEARVGLKPLKLVISLGRASAMAVFLFNGWVVEPKELQAALAHEHLHNVVHVV